MTEETPTPPAAAPDSEEPKPSTEFAEALDAFEAKQPAPIKTDELRVGARVKAKVVSVGDEHLVLDVGGRSEAIAEVKHFRDKEGSVSAKPGDTLDLIVASGPDPLTLAPSIKAQPNAALAQLREAQAANAPVSGKVTGINAGGLSVDVGGVRGFCPFSQIEAGFCADPSVYLSRTLDFLVTEVKDGKGGVVLSRKRLLRRSEQESAKKLLASLKVGDELEGKVARLENFGAFVDIGGIDGLIHVSEIRHDRTHHPKEVLSEGETVKVKVLRIESGKDGRPRIALSIKAAQPDPWAGIENRYPRGTRVKGTVVRLTDFGAFVQLEPGIDGLVHVSEVAPTRIEHVKEALTRGQEIEAVVLGADSVKKRISLSIKATSEEVLAQPASEFRERGGERGERSEGGGGGGGGGGGRREGGRREGGPRREGFRSEGGRGEGGRPAGRENRREGRRENRGDGGRREGRDRGEGVGRREGGRRDGGRRDSPTTTISVSSSSPNDPPPMTTMAIALREAMEKAKEKERSGGGG